MAQCKKGLFMLHTYVISVKKSRGLERGGLFIKVREWNRPIEAPSWHLLPKSSWPKTVVLCPGWNLPSRNGTHFPYDSLARANHLVTPNFKRGWKVFHQLLKKKERIGIGWISLRMAIEMKPIVAEGYGSRGFCWESEGLWLIRTTFVPGGTVRGRVREGVLACTMA